jgi:hypothetical protein
LLLCGLARDGGSECDVRDRFVEGLDRQRGVVEEGELGKVSQVPAQRSHSSLDLLATLAAECHLSSRRCLPEPLLAVVVDLTERHLTPSPVLVVDDAAPSHHRLAEVKVRF